MYGYNVGLVDIDLIEVKGLVEGLMKLLRGAADWKRRMDVPY